VPPLGKLGKPRVLRSQIKIKGEEPVARAVLSKGESLREGVISRTGSKVLMAGGRQSKRGAKTRLTEDDTTPMKRAAASAAEIRLRGIEKGCTLSGLKKKKEPMTAESRKGRGDNCTSNLLKRRNVKQRIRVKKEE